MSAPKNLSETYRKLREAPLNWHHPNHDVYQPKSQELLQTNPVLWAVVCRGARTPETIALYLLMDPDDVYYQLTQLESRGVVYRRDHTTYEGWQLAANSPYTPLSHYCYHIRSHLGDPIKPTAKSAPRKRVLATLLTLPTDRWYKVSEIANRAEVSTQTIRNTIRFLPNLPVTTRLHPTHGYQVRRT